VLLRELATLELSHDAGDVSAGLAVGGNAVVAVDGGGASVVGGESEGEIVVVSGEELVEVGGAAGDVLVGMEGVVDAELLGGAGHELHEAAGSGAGDGVGVASAFGFDDAGEELDVDVVLRSGLGEEVVDVGGRGGGDGRGLRGIGEGLDSRDGSGGEVDEVGDLIGRLGRIEGEKEANVATVDGYAASAVVGEAVAQGDSLQGVQRRAEGHCKKEGSDVLDTCWMTSVHQI